MKTFSIPLLLWAFLLAGCQSNPKDFKLVFTIESLNAYKVSIEIDNDKSYRIQQQNLFFDAHAKKAHINKYEGKLTDEDFKELTVLINRSRLFEMKNTYGFIEQENSDDDPLDGLMFHLNYTEGSKSKYILIHPNPVDTYPKDFSDLINFLSNHTSTYSKQ